MLRLENPFITSGYHSPKYFCDRKAETGLLSKYIRNGNNITLFALRRLGKTGLIHHVFNSLASSKKITCLYVDILPTTDIRTFTNSLASAIFSRFPEKKSIGSKFIALLKSFRPVISYDPLTGNPELSFALANAGEYEKTIQQIFSFLDKLNRRIVIAIDEFQQILNYPEKNTEALLRSIIQRLKNINFIFCGSNQRLINEMFRDAKRPFYNSALYMTLENISPLEYSAFILSKFKEVQKSISSEAINFILAFTDTHTYYTQVLCNQVFASNKKNISLTDVHEISAALLSQNEPVFYQFRNLLTAAQWNLLIAISKEEKVVQLYAADFIKKYTLESSSLVKRNIESLLSKEMVYLRSDSEKSYYSVYDKFLMRWLSRQ
jgi:AAA+ ATPase superfamily predicted ATPase